MLGCVAALEQNINDGLVLSTPPNAPSTLDVLIEYMPICSPLLLRIRAMVEGCTDTVFGTEELPPLYSPLILTRPWLGVLTSSCTYNC